MRKGRTLIILVVVLALLIGGYAYLGKKKTNTTDEAASTALIKVDVNTIKSINLKGADYTLDLEKGNTDWQVKSQTGLALDQTSVLDIANSLASLSADKVVDTNPQNLQDYGLQNPVVTVTMTMADGTQKVVYLGNKTAGNSDYYLMIKDDPKLYTIASTDGDHLSYKLGDVRDKTLPAMDSSSAVYLKIARPDTTLEFFDAQDYSGWGSWGMSKPYSRYYSADDTAVGNLINTLTQNLKIDQFVDDNPSSLAKYGLDKPSMEIELKDVPNTLILDFGKDAGDSQIYFKTNKSNSVYTIEKDTISDFINAKPFDYLDKAIFMPSIDDVDKLVVQAGSKTDTFTLTRTAAPTTTPTPTTTAGDQPQTVTTYNMNGKKMDEDTFKNFLTNLYGLQYETESEKAVPDKPDFTTTFYLNKGEERTVTVGYAPYNADFYAVFINGKSNFLISRDKVNQIISGLSGLEQGE